MVTGVKEAAQQSARLRERIIKKFGNLSRFSALSGITYNKLCQYLADGSNLELIAQSLKNTEDRPLPTEITSELINSVYEKLAHMEKHDKISRKEFCSGEGISGYWLEMFLSGKVKFRNKRVQRLLQILEIE